MNWNEQEPQESVQSNGENLEPVTLHVYDVTNAGGSLGTAIRRLNNITKVGLGIGGIFHAALEVYGEEWSYGYCPHGTGIYSCQPKKNGMYTYRESVPLGATALSKGEVRRSIKQLMEEWRGEDYDLLRKNCCHFSERLADVLGCGPLPAWVNRFATGAHNIAEGYNRTQQNLSTLIQRISAPPNPSAHSERASAPGL